MLFLHTQRVIKRQVEKRMKKDVNDSQANDGDSDSDHETDIED